MTVAILSVALPLAPFGAAAASRPRRMIDEYIVLYGALLRQSGK